MAIKRLLFLGFGNKFLIGCIKYVAAKLPQTEKKGNK
jgi:hypothetical protein